MHILTFLQNFKVNIFGSSPTQLEKRGPGFEGLRSQVFVFDQLPNPENILFTFIVLSIFQALRSKRYNTPIMIKQPMNIQTGPKSHRTIGTEK